MISVGYYAVILIVGLFAAVIGPSLPFLAETTQVQLGLLGSLFTLRSFGGLLGSYQGGRMFDRFPGHAILISALLALAALMSLIPLVNSLWVLWILIFFLGVCESTLDVGVNTLLLWKYSRRVAPFLNGLHFFFGTGAFISPLIIAWSVGATESIAWAYWIVALAALPAAAWVAGLKSPQRQAVEEPQAQDKSLFTPLVAMIAGIFFLYVGAEVAFGGWIYTYAVSLHLANTTTAAYLNSAFWGMLTLGRLIAIPVSTRVSPSKMIFLALAGCLVSLVVLALFSESSTALWLGSLGLGYSMASIFPTLLVFAEERLAITGRQTGWFFVAANAGAMFLPWLAGVMFQSAGSRGLMLLILADVMLALLIFAFLSITVSRPIIAETITKG